MSFTATWMDLEMIILSEVRKRQMLCDINYMWNLKKKDTNKLFYEIETDPQSSKTNS